MQLLFFKVQRYVPTKQPMLLVKSIPEELEGFKFGVQLGQQFSLGEGEQHKHT